MLASHALAIILHMASTEDITAPWADTYEETASAIAFAADTDQEAYTLLAIGWIESRYNPAMMGDCAKGVPTSVKVCQSHGAFQLSKHWLAARSGIVAQALTAIRLVRLSAPLSPAHPLSWYACGHAPPFPSSCARASQRVTLLSALLAHLPIDPTPDATEPAQALLSHPRQAIAP
jgi:hypothetical protein